MSKTNMSKYYPAQGRDARSYCCFCIKLMKWIPALFVSALFFWSYYAYVFQLCLKAVEDRTRQIACLVLYHLLATMKIWTYLRVTFTDPGSVPPAFRLGEGEVDRLMHADSDQMERAILQGFSERLPLATFSSDGSVRYCSKCDNVKPDRSHHCSVCGRCVLKMDHHCPWINNCVGFANYKSFILYLAYSVAYCAFISATSFRYTLTIWGASPTKAGRFHISFLFLTALMLAVSLGSLLGYHGFLVARNRTTLEVFKPAVFAGGPDKNGFDLGCRRNVREALGECPLTWFLPLGAPSGDGVRFPVRNVARSCRDVELGVQ